MASTDFGGLSRKRKRKVSRTSSDTISTWSTASDDPEVFFSSPSKKRLRQEISPSRKSPLSQLVDEEISFKIVDPVDVVDQLTFAETTSTLDDATVEGEAPTVPPRRSPNGYILPDPLPPGLILTDLKNVRWRLGRSVGLGGFGEIYSAARLNGVTDAEEENFVVKVVRLDFFYLSLDCQAVDLLDGYIQPNAVMDSVLDHHEVGLGSIHLNAFFSSWA